MDLHSVTLPGAIGDLHFEVGDFTGFDRLLTWLPEKILRDVVARRIAKSLAARGLDPRRRVTFCLPGEMDPTEVILGEHCQFISTRPFTRL